MTEKKQSQSGFIELGIPFENPELLSVLGMLAVSHGNLEMVQIMCLKILEGLTPAEAIKKYRRRSVTTVRKEIHKIIKPHLEGGEPINKAAQSIEKLVNKARCVSEQRNDLIHCFWGKHEGHWVVSPDETQWNPMPDVAVVKKLSADILQVTVELNKERLETGKAFDTFLKERKAMS